MASASAQPAALSAEQAKVVLAEVIQAFSAPENAVRMDEARDNACNDMGKMLQFVLPVATQIQQEVIKAYGFSCDGEGVLKFARLVKSYEAQDPEIASLSGKLKALFLPPMTLPPHGPASGSSVAAPDDAGVGDLAARESPPGLTLIFANGLQRILSSPW